MLVWILIKRLLQFDITWEYVFENMQSKSAAI